MKFKLTADVFASIDTERYKISLILYSVVKGKEIPSYHCEFDEFNDSFVEELPRLIGLDVPTKTLNQVQAYLDKIRPHMSTYSDRTSDILCICRHALDNAEEQDYNEVEAEVVAFLWKAEQIYTCTLAKIGNAKQLEEQKKEYNFIPTESTIISCRSGSSYNFQNEIEMD